MGGKSFYIPIAMMFSAFSAILNILPFYYIWKISKEIFLGSNNFSNQNVKHYALLVFVYSLLAILSYFAALFISHSAAFEVELQLKKKGCEKIMDMPLGFFNMYSSGHIRKVINDGAASTHTFLAHQLPDMAASTVTPIIVIFIFFYFDWRLGIASLLPILLSFIIMSRMMNDEREELRKKYISALEEMSSESVEYVSSISVVKTFGQSIKSFTRFYNSIENYRKLVVFWTKMLSKQYSLYIVLLQSSVLFLIPVAMIMIESGENISNVISTFILYLLVSPQLSFVMMKNVNYKNQKFLALQSIERFEALFKYDVFSYPINSQKFENQELEFKNVCFSYDGKENVLKNISFKVRKGETLALVGPSGSGKTTIARLAARFWDVNSGEVLIGSHNIKAYSKNYLMNNISFVFQNNKLFKTSIRDNICFGREVKEEELEMALIKSRAKEIIDKLEDGLNTVIGKKGVYLSGGEQQRIALARAFIKDAPIILLDEATAFTDPENEHHIQSALKEISKGKTTIMIAHRMTTVRSADNIAVVDNGQIVEYGNHENLINQNGLYKKMWDEYKTSIAWSINRGK